jgi:hypothetical protein
MLFHQREECHRKARLHRRNATRPKALAVQSKSFDQRSGSPVTALDATVHEAKEVGARMHSGKLQAAMKCRFRG